MPYLYTNINLLSDIENISDGEETNIQRTFYFFTTDIARDTPYLIVTGYNFFLMDNVEDAFQLFTYHALKESQECRPSKMSMFQGATFSCPRKQRLSITTDSTVRTVPTEELESKIEVMKQESKEIIQAFNDARELDPASCYYFFNNYSNFGCSKRDVELRPNKVWSAYACSVFGSEYSYSLMPIMQNDGTKVPLSTIVSPKGERILNAIQDSHESKYSYEFNKIFINGKSVF